MDSALETLNQGIADDAPEIVYLHAIEVAIVALSKCPKATSELLADLCTAYSRCSMRDRELAEQRRIEQ